MLENSVSVQKKKERLEREWKWMQKRLKATDVNLQITNLNSVWLDYDEEEGKQNKLQKSPTKVENRLLNAGEKT